MTSKLPSLTGIKLMLNSWDEINQVLNASRYETSIRRQCQIVLRHKRLFRGTYPVNNIRVLELWAVTPVVTLQSTLKASDNSGICPLGPLVIVVVVVVVSSRSTFTVTGRTICRVTSLFAVSAL
ncbi:hypothetical protein Tco_0409676 [Tanacetum coccineum]